MSEDSPYRSPKSHLGEPDSLSTFKKAAYSFTSIVVGFVIVDLGNFVFDELIATSMDWSVRRGESFNLNILIVRACHTFIFSLAAGYATYRISKAWKIWHPVALMLIFYSIWFIAGGDETLPVWAVTPGILGLSIGILGGGLIGIAIDNKNHNKRMQSDHPIRYANGLAADARR